MLHQFREDQRRGLFSYEALRTRLSDNQFSGGATLDLAGPVIRLPNLTPEDLFVLLSNITNVQAAGDPTKRLVTDEAIEAVLRRANEVMGAEFFKTPRDVVRAFVGLLNILEQNPTADWKNIVGADFIKKPAVPMSAEEAVAAGDVPKDEEDLATFKL